MFLRKYYFMLNFLGIWKNVDISYSYFLSSARPNIQFNSIVLKQKITRHQNFSSLKLECWKLVKIWAHKFDPTIMNQLNFRFEKITSFKIMRGARECKKHEHSNNNSSENSSKLFSVLILSYSENGLCNAQWCKFNIIFLKSVQINFLKLEINFDSKIETKYCDGFFCIIVWFESQWCVLIFLVDELSSKSFDFKSRFESQIFIVLFRIFP